MHKQNFWITFFSSSSWWSLVSSLCSLLVSLKTKWGICKNISFSLLKEFDEFLKMFFFFLARHLDSSKLLKLNANANVCKHQSQPWLGLDTLSVFCIISNYGQIFVIIHGSVDGVPRSKNFMMKFKFHSIICPPLSSNWYTEKWLEDSMNNCSATNAGSINYNLITIYRVGMNDSFQRAISHLQLLLLVGNSGVHLSSSQLESQHRIRSNEWVRSSEWRTERKMSIHVGRIYYIRWTGLEFVIQAAKRNEFN